MDTGTLIGFLIVIGAPILLVYLVARACYRKYHKWQQGRLENATKGIAGWIALSCIIPMGAAIKGKKFKTIDWEAIKEEHKFRGHDDTSEFLNKIFFGEIDAVVKSIRDGELDQIEYMQSAWVRGNPSRAIPGLVNEVEKYVKSDEREESYKFIRELGEELLVKVKKALAEDAADRALNEEYEEIEEEEEEESYDDDSSYDDSSYEEPERESKRTSTPSNTSSSQPSTPQRQPTRAPQPKQTYAKPRESNAYYVERMAPGGYSYQRITGGDGNIRNAQRRLEQAQKAHAGTDNLKNNASPARYRIVDKNGKVQ